MTWTFANKQLEGVLALMSSNLFKAIEKARTRQRALETEREELFARGTTGYLRQKNARKLTELTEHIARLEQQIDSESELVGQSESRVREAQAATATPARVVTLTSADKRGAGIVRRGTPSSANRGTFVPVPDHLVTTLMALRGDTARRRIAEDGTRVQRVQPHRAGALIETH